MLALSRAIHIFQGYPMSVLTVICICMLGHYVSSQEHFTLEDIVPMRYAYLHVPKNSSNEPIEVAVRIGQISIRTIDESDLSFSVSLELWLYWKDARLHYPSEDGRFVLLDNAWMAKIWNPKVYFRNAFDGKLDNIITPTSMFWLSLEHVIYNCNKVYLKLICEMDLHNFPHDQQECDIQMCSSTYSNRELYLKWFLRGKDPTLFALNQYNIKELKWDNFTDVREGSVTTSCLRLAVVLDRRTGYFLINVYIPSALIVSMSMLTFWIPPDAVPARTTLGVTSLLTIITKQREAEMPNVSYIVALNVWLSFSIGFVFLSLLEFAFVTAISSYKNDVGFSWRGRKDDLPMVMLKSNGTWSLKNQWSSKKPVEHSSTSWPKRLDMFSRVFFPLGFGVFAFIYWHIYNNPKK